MKNTNNDLENRQILLFDETGNGDLPGIAELPDGVYRAMFYSNVFELENGEMYKTDFSIQRKRDCSEWKTYVVRDGEPLCTGK